MTFKYLRHSGRAQGATLEPFSYADLRQHDETPATMATQPPVNPTGCQPSSSYGSHLGPNGSTHNNVTMMSEIIRWICAHWVCLAGY